MFDGLLLMFVETWEIVRYLTNLCACLLMVQFKMLFHSFICLKLVQTLLYSSQELFLSIHVCLTWNLESWVFPESAFMKITGLDAWYLHGYKRDSDGNTIF